EHMRALQEAEAPPERKSEATGTATPAAAPAAAKKRKRRFPYRKVSELEVEIAAAEKRLRELEQRLASPELYRDGERVKETTSAFEELIAQLQHLYEHWEEAVELN